MINSGDDITPETTTFGLPMKGLNYGKVILSFWYDAEQ